MFITYPLVDSVAAGSGGYGAFCGSFHRILLNGSEDPISIYTESSMPSTAARAAICPTPDDVVCETITGAHAWRAEVVKRGIRWSVRVISPDGFTFWLSGPYTIAVDAIERATFRSDIFAAHDARLFLGNMKPAA